MLHSLEDRIVYLITEVAFAIVADDAIPGRRISVFQKVRKNRIPRTRRRASCPCCDRMPGLYARRWCANNPTAG